MTCIHAKPKPAKKRSSERVVIMRIRLHYYCTRVCCLFTIIASNRSKQPHCAFGFSHHNIHCLFTIIASNRSKQLHLRFWLLPLLLSILWRLKGGEKLKNEDLSALRKCSLILRSMALQSVARKRIRASQCACTASLSQERRRTFEVHNPHRLNKMIVAFNKQSQSHKGITNITRNIPVIKAKNMYTPHTTTIIANITATCFPGAFVCSSLHRRKGYWQERQGSALQGQHFPPCHSKLHAPGEYVFAYVCM